MRLEDAQPASDLESSKSFNNMARQAATAEGFQQMMTLQSNLQRSKTTYLSKDPNPGLLPYPFSDRPPFESLWRKLGHNIPDEDGHRFCINVSRNPLSL